jgi:hypothetical protein
MHKTRAICAPKMHLAPDCGTTRERAMRATHPDEGLEFIINILWFMA